MKSIMLSSLLLCSLWAAAQVPSFPSGKEKYDGKPERFQRVPKEKPFGVELAQLHRLMVLGLREQATVQCAEEYTFQGSVIEKRSESPGVFTMVMRATEDQDLVFTLSRITIDGKTTFRGIILHPNHSDALLLEPDENGKHAWKSIKRSSLLAD